MVIRSCSWLAAVLVLGACASNGASDGAFNGASDGKRAAPVADHAASAKVQSSPSPSTERTPSMQLGNFSVCLAVKSLAVSRAFYEKLGFTQVSGDASQGWLVLKNGAARIGIFQGILEKNTLTFNPGWTADAQPLADFEDVRDLQRTLQERGITPAVAADTTGDGHAYFILSDPDGNPIFVDQHVPRPKR